VKPLWRRASGAAFATLAAAAFVLLGLYAYHLTVWPAKPDRGFLVSFDFGPNVVAQTRPLGEASGLRNGDRILSVNGIEYDTLAGLLAALVLEEGRDNVYQIERGGEALEVPVPVRPLGYEIVLQHNLPTLVLGLIFAGLGVLVFLMKPHEVASWAFFLVVTLLGLVFTYARSPFS
jgi:hypothetical protein